MAITDLDQPDKDLGNDLWVLYLQALAKEKQLPLTDRIVAQIKSLVPTLEANDPANNSVEKALRKAAGGDFEAAGKAIRHHLLDGAIKIKTRKYAEKGIAAAKQGEKFKAAGIKRAREEAEPARAECVRVAKELIAKRVDKPFLSYLELSRRVIAVTGKGGESTVRKHLKAVGLLEK